MDQISNGTISTDSETFNSKYNEYKTTGNTSQKGQLLLELVDIYEQDLSDKATVQYIN